MTHVVAGFPSIKESQKIVEMMDTNGADVIEIQIPFSDPVADGPTMMRCNELSLERGFVVDNAFEMAKNLTKDSSSGEEASQKIMAPLLFMTYYNIVFQRGVEVFCKEAKEAGISGLIIPDIPIEEEKNEGFFATCRKHNLAWIPVVSPVTSEERIRELTKYANGFWYVVSRAGVTGAQENFSHAAEKQIQWIRMHSDLPVALAFGVSKKEHLQAIAKDADMAVIGSAVQNIFLQEENKFDKNLKQAEEFLCGVRE